MCRQRWECYSVFYWKVSISSVCGFGLQIFVLWCLYHTWKSVDCLRGCIIDFHQATPMGNRFSNRASSIDAQACDLDLSEFQVDNNLTPSDSSRHRKAEVDWEDETSVHHRSAMNCLHNYAIGKMCEKRLVDSKADDEDQRVIRRSDSRKSLTFADALEETFVFVKSDASLQSRSGCADDHSCSSDRSAVDCL